MLILRYSKTAFFALFLITSSQLINISIGFKFPISRSRIVSTPLMSIDIPKSPKEVFSGALSTVVAISIGTLFGAATAYASDAANPQITQKVYLNIKIANYTEESVGTNKGATGSGRVVIGLYGKDAPESVKRFLSVIQSNGLEFPSYLESQFTRITEDGLLEVERVRGVNTINIAGTDVLEYDGNILSQFTTIMETNGLRHDTRGLLTRRQLTSGPEFGITVSPAPALDGFHVIF
eukprot:gene8610-17769_t